MLVNTLLQYHEEVHIYTRATAVMEFGHPDVTLYEYTKPYANAPWYLRLPGQIMYQSKITYGLLWRRNHVDLVLFRGGGYIIPMVAMRLMGVVVVFRLAGVLYQQEVDVDSLMRLVWVRFLAFLQWFLCGVASVVVVTSESVIEFGNIEEFQKKTHVWCHYYFDLKLFNKQTPYRERDSIVGQVGIISRVKGSLNMIVAIGSLAEEHDFSLLVVGDGPEMDRAKRLAAEKRIDAEFTDRIERREVPDQLNRMKLLILSSVSEGVPKIVLEAMACGTPPVATDVGGVADFIEDGETGFLIENNDPDRIANGIDTALNHDLVTISDQARDYIEEHFSYENAVREYHRFLREATSLTVSPPPENPEKPIPEPSSP